MQKVESKKTNGRRTGQPDNPTHDGFRPAGPEVEEKRHYQDFAHPCNNERHDENKKIPQHCSVARRPWVFSHVCSLMLVTSRTAIVLQPARSDSASSRLACTV